MSIQRYKRVDSFPRDTRDFNPERCSRFYSDFFNVGDFAETIVAQTGTPTITYAAEFSPSNQTAGVVSLTIPNTVAAAGGVARIADTGSADSAVIKFGTNEFDVMARVNLQRGTASAGDVYHRFGFWDTVTARENAGECTDGLVFQCLGASTWSVGFFSGWNGTSGTKFVKDTGIPVNQWNTLSIWVSADGSMAVWQIGETVVHVQTRDMLGSGSTAVRCGFIARTTGTISTAYVSKVDFMQLRMFVNRGKA
jgi:hypothetical protein